MIRWFFSIVCSCSLLLACQDSNKNSEEYLPSSSGKINQVLVVIDNDLWTSLIGEELRKNLAELLVGMSQDEPRFTLIQTPYEGFDGLMLRQRVFLEVRIGRDELFEIKNNVFAKPQTGIYLYGRTLSDVLQLIQTHAPTIKNTITTTELREQHSRLNALKMPIPQIEENLKVTFTLPNTYRIAKLTDNFAWMRRDIRSGDLNLLVYELPLNRLENQEDIIGQIIQIRDSIGQAHIPGPNEGSYMITEMAFSPHLFETTINQKFAYETRGTWEVYNFFMAGPFVNFMIKDSVNNRLLVMEGFTFAPSIDKRNYQFELETIIRSAKLLE